jgi:GNAT superfamily N-acetyltransferase
VNIRPARTSEASALTALALRSKAHWGYSAAFMAACRDELTVHEHDIREGRVVLADDGGAIAGFYALLPPDGDRCELDALFVEPAAIGRGIGRRLFAHAATTARAQGARRLEIQADPNAEAFYRREGAHTVGTRPSASIPHRSLPLMVLDLDGWRAC